MSPHRTAPLVALVISSLVLSSIIPSHALAAQSLESRVNSARGSVAFEYRTRANVCGNGSSISISDDSTAGWNTRTHRSGMRIGYDNNGDVSRCEEGPARIVIDRAGGAVTDVHVTIGGNPPHADTELGRVSSTEAARYLLSIAPSAPGNAGDHAILGAAVADSAVIWKRLIEIARDNAASDKARKSAMFWVSQEATVAATAGLDAVASDDDAAFSVRTDALFFLAQRKNNEGIPALIRVARDSKSPKLRKEAIWHLSQSKDPRAIDLFEKLLAGK